MEKAKTAPQPLMKRVVYPFVLGIGVYLLSSSLFFAAGLLLTMRWRSTFASFTFVLAMSVYFISFFALVPLLTLAFAYQRSSLWKKDKRKIAALVAKQK